MWFFILILVVLALWLFHKFFKIPRFSAVTVITGGVKSGKSALTVRFALKSYRRARFFWRIKKFIAKLFKRIPPEAPLLYSNIPLLKVKYVQLTDAHLQRKVRFNYGSIVILDEASLVADSQLGSSQTSESRKIGTQLLLFFKLFGHETKGGKIFVNSHGITDLHYALKRTTSTYYYVHSLSKFPFISSFHLREERYSEDGTVVNSYDEDVQKSMLRILMLNRMYKKYDAFCYSVFTDNLPVDNDLSYITRRDGLKCCKIVSFRPEFKNLTVSEVIENHEKT